MRFIAWSKRRTRWLILFVLAVVLLPYLFSRLASPWRRISIHGPAELSATPSNSVDNACRIACYNIAHGRGTAESNWNGGDAVERFERLDQIAKLLREVDADVVVLNEVDFDCSWSNSINQAEYLAKQAGYPYRLEERNLDLRVWFWAWRFGNAILSKHPIDNAQVIELPQYTPWESLAAGNKRACQCDVAIDGQPMRIVAAHLSHRSESVRVESAQTIAKLASKSPHPVVVAGDMNSTPPGFPTSESDSNGYNAITTFDRSDLFRRLPVDESINESDMTFHASDPVSVIDWILISKEASFLEYDVVVPSTLSDHRLVYAEIRVGE